jgi:hypothetical protein
MTLSWPSSRHSDEGMADSRPAYLEVEQLLEFGLLMSGIIGVIQDGCVLKYETRMIETETNVSEIE